MATSRWSCVVVARDEEGVSEMIWLPTLREQFQTLTGVAGAARDAGVKDRVFSAPGRVNLIGEHTDYNDGYVLPMALGQRTYVVAAPRNDGRIRCWSTRFQGEVSFELNGNPGRGDDWANHIRGIAACLVREEYRLVGADLLIDSDLPIGAGLSSSAAVEVAVGYALLKLADEPIDLVDLALAAQQAEHEFVGTKCGIMDQYIACLGVEDHALLIDCRNLEYRAVPLDLAEVDVVICNSMVRHDLATSEYNIRRAECEEGVRRLAGHLPGISSLRDVHSEEFDLYAGSLPPIVQHRCNHVITEIARTLEAVAALERHDLTTFGKLMYASHQSLRDDYEVSCPELDLLVRIASDCKGVFGARMTGGGFGGSTVNLVRRANVREFIETIEDRFQARTGVKPESYVCRASGGVREELG